jgi:hypothetical protein
MPSSQQQTRRRFASLYADRNQDPARGNIQSINQLFGVNGTNDSEPSHIRSRVSSASLQGPGVASILQLTDGSNGRLQRIFHPFIYQPGLVSTGSPYENQLIGIDGDLMGDNMAYSAVLKPKLPPEEAEKQSRASQGWRKPPLTAAGFFGFPVAL